MTKEEAANSFLKGFFEYNYNRKKLLFDNLKNIYVLISFIYNNIEKIENEEIDWNQITKTTLFEEEKIIDSFYKEIGVNLELDEIIKDGTFNIVRTNELEEAYPYELTLGVNNYEGEHKSIDVYNNGIITDSIIWVHEISHYRNQPENHRSEVNDLLTELLAFTEEFIYMDYLEKKGYKNDANIFKIEEYKNLYNHIKIGFPVARIYLLYFLLGEVSNENYKYLYHEDNSYEKALDVFNAVIKQDQNIIFNILWYSVGVISIYNYERYKEDSKYLDKIKELNTKINTDISLEDALKIIDIKLDSESLNRILEYINNFKNKLSKKKCDYTTRV